MEAEWARMKRGIALANQPNTTKEAVEAFHASLKRARDEVVADCRAERKRARAKQSSADLSDASMRDSRRSCRFPASDLPPPEHVDHAVTPPSC